MYLIRITYKSIWLILLLAGFSQGAIAQKTSAYGYNKVLLKNIDKQLDNAQQQYRYFCSQTDDTLFPKTLKKDGSLESSKSWWWCTGFFPGTLLYLTEFKKDDSLLNEANYRLKLLEREKNNKGTHDLGFMMYCSFGNAMRLYPDKKYEEILLQSAKSLSTRFSPVTGCIRSWNSKKPNDYIVIIDNMMNLELLTYATSVSGDSSFYKIAISHADKTIQHHFRSDYSSFHVVDYDPATGEVNNRRTHQGANDSSAWSRGQAWGLYGFTMLYRETKLTRYLEQANQIAEFIINHPNLPEDKIPYWDFNAPGIPNTNRDASAAAIMASALIELSTFSKGSSRDKYLKIAEQILTSLSSSEYRSAVGESRGFLLKHSVGSLPHQSEVDVPLTYADYYYVEAMLRYKKLASGKKLY